MKQSKSLKHVKILLLILSAFLTAIPYLIPSFYWISYFGLIPLMCLLFKEKRNTKSLFFFGWLFGFLFYLAIFHWFLNLHPLAFLNISNTTSFIIVWGGYFLICLYEGLFFGLIAALFSKLRTGAWYDSVTIAFLWIFAEWLQGFGILGLPLGRLAVTQFQNIPMLQSISLFGAFFLSFLIVLTNAILGYCVANWKKRESIIRLVVFALIICTLNYGYGLFHLAKPDSTESPLRISLIQGNISSNQKWASDSAKSIFDTYYQLSVQAIETDKPDAVVWPETVIPFDLNETSFLNKIQETAHQYETPFIIGGFYYDAEAKKDYNAIYYINKKGEVTLPLYYKRQLVPFGEFLPFRQLLGKLFPVLNDINAAGSDLAAGTESFVTELEGVAKFGSLICFDSIFSDFSRESVQNGAELLTLVTNDSWFKDSAGVYQHNAHAVLRAVENQRSVIRAANTGISCFITPHGEIQDSLAPLTTGSISAEVLPKKDRTFYNRTGDLILLSGIIYMLLLMIERRRSREDE